jgi:uncharacterized membrane protein YbhN (UPF0104 family)
VHAVGADLKHYFLAMQVGNSIGAIPVVPAGVGARDYVIQEFLKAAGMAPGKAVSAAILFTLTFTAWYLLGGVVFVFSRFRHAERAPAPPPAGA